MQAPPLLPAATFPPFWWFELGRRAGAQVCVHENYVKQSLRNRVALVGAQGATDLSLPVNRRGAIERGVENIVFTERVRPEMLLNALQTNCGRAPFFEHYYPEIELWAHQHLIPSASWLNAALASTEWACDALKVSHPLPTQEYSDGNEHDDWRPKARWRNASTARYPQVFEDRFGFVSGRSILDVLFHLGPEASELPSSHGNHDVA